METVLGRTCMRKVTDRTVTGHVNYWTLAYFNTLQAFQLMLARYLTPAGHLDEPDF